MDTDDRRVLDVRDHEVPFEAITEALSELPEGGRLLLRNDFEPEPLYPVLEERGFTHSAAERDGVWEVEIERAPE
jgi:uncharacterized protein (DUF2249 family)